MNCSNNISKVFASLVVGVAIGSVLGVLYAPAKGSETRRKFSCRHEETDALTESLKEKFNDLIEEIRLEVETAKNKQNDLA